MVKLGLVGTLWPVILATWFGDAFSIFLLRQFFLTIPQEYIDAARVDGCGEFRILTTVVLRLAKPAIAAVALFSVLYCFNDYFLPLLYVGQGDIHTWPVSIGLSQFRNLHQVQWNLTMAATLLVMWPSAPAPTTGRARGRGRGRGRRRARGGGEGRRRRGHRAGRHGRRDRARGPSDVGAEHVEAGPLGILRRQGNAETALLCGLALGAGEQGLAYVADGAAAFAGAAVAIALEPDLRPRVRASDEIGSDLESVLEALRAASAGTRGRRIPYRTTTPD